MSKRGKFFIYSPIFTKLGMKVCHGTLTTEKILRSGYHDDGCQGEQKTFSRLKYCLDINQNLVGKLGMSIEKKAQSTRFHGNQYVAMATKKGFL